MKKNAERPTIVFLPDLADEYEADECTTEACRIVRRHYDHGVRGDRMTINHGLYCADKDGCPFDARRCSCWTSGCTLAENGA